MSIIFVIGAVASGKTQFIKKHFAECQHFSMADYQNGIKEAMGNPASLAINQYRELLVRANQMMMQEVAEAIRENRSDIVVEHTLFKAKRRLLWMDLVRAITDQPVMIYVMTPNKEQHRKYLESRKDIPAESYDNILRETKEMIEIPNSEEGFREIYLVTGEKIERSEQRPDPDIIRRCRKELEEEEEERIQMEKKAAKCKEILEDFQTKPFRHICEVCGKSEMLTAEEAHQQGWDYPPHMGQWGVVSPRTCGDCEMKETIYWKLAVMHKSTAELSTKEREVLTRILQEPFSLTS